MSKPCFEDEQGETIERFVDEEESEILRMTELEQRNVSIIHSAPDIHGASNFPEREQPRRKRKLTDKGKSYQIETLGRKRQNAYSTLSRQINKIRQSVETSVDSRALEFERDQIDKLKDAFNEAQRSFDDTLETAEDKQTSYHWFDVRDREFTEFRIKITERIQALERRSYRTGSIKSGHSGRSKRSAVSEVSRASSAHSLRLEAAAKTARLKTEMEFLERENEMRRFQLMKEIAIADAEENAIKGILDEESAKLGEREEWDIKPEPELKFNPHVPPFVPSLPALAQVPETKGSDENRETLKELVALQAKQTELSSLLIQQHKISHLPAKEPPVFAGDALEYTAFISAFDSIISINVSSNRDRLYFLEKYTRGKANEVIKGFLAVSSEEAYNEARKLLDQRFGNPVHVAEAYKARMRNWPQINDGDSSGLQDFSDFLVRCQEAVKIVGSLAELDSTQTLRQMTAKLPSYSGVKWCRHAHEAQTKSSVRVSFSDFVKFVKGEANLANDPLFSPDALKREKRKQSDKDQRSKPRKGGTASAGSFATNAASPTTTGFPAARCPLCEKSHSLEKCAELKRKTSDERRDFVSAKGLCFGCLRKGHLSRSCQSRLTCEEWSQSHPTVLHGAKPKRRNNKSFPGSSQTSNTNRPARSPATDLASETKTNESANANASVCGSTSQSDGVTTSMIVPVVLHHKARPVTEVTVTRSSMTAATPRLSRVLFLRILAYGALKSRLSSTRCMGGPKFQSKGLKA